MTGINKVIAPTCAMLLGGACLVGVAHSARAWDNQYIDRMDTITSGAGNSVAHNMAVHTINPWPRYVGNDRITIDGRRIALGHSRYQKNRSIPPVGTATSGVGFSGGQGAATPGGDAGGDTGGANSGEGK